MTGRIALLKGGWSAERDVSLVTGRECARALREEGYNVTEIDVMRDLKKLIAALENAKPDAVFNALHGRWGEDGHIQAVLEILEIPYTHSGPLASALAIDKQKTKEIVQPLGVRCPEGKVVTVEDIRAGKLDIPPPYVVKPVQEGSSVGVRIVREGDNRGPLGGNDWGFGAQALVEVYIPGKELSVAVMGGRDEEPRALTVTEIRPKIDFYDYDAKYADGGSEHILPAAINDDAFEAARKFAVTAHKALGCSGVTRSDFRLDESRPGADGLYFLEINTQPGMTPTSLVPEQAQHLGISFGRLCGWMIENAQCHG